jgi:hypothetical protein
MDTRGVGALACGSLLTFLNPVVSGFVATVPIQALVLLTGGLLSIVGSSMILWTYFNS